MGYTHIFFDLGFTLVERKREEAYGKILKRHGIKKSYEELKKAFHLADKTFFREYPGVLGEEDKYYLAWYYAVVNYYLKVQIDLEDLVKNLKEVKGKLKWQAFSYTLDTLKRLHKMGYQIGLISNWDLSCRRVLKQTGIDAFLDYTIISSEVGVAKPDKHIFEIALEQAKISPEKALYIGDNYYDDVCGCQKVNMDCYLINPANRFGIEEISYPYVIEDISVLPEKLKYKEVAYVC